MFQGDQTSWNFCRTSYLFLLPSAAECAGMAQVQNAPISSESDPMSLGEARLAAGKLPLQLHTWVSHIEWPRAPQKPDLHSLQQPRREETKSPSATGRAECDSLRSNHNLTLPMQIHLGLTQLPSITESLQHS